MYRICLKKWSGQLIASGRSARWNSTGNKLIYTSAARSLACLENLVHRHGRGVNEDFRVMAIEIPSSKKMEKIEPADLPVKWFEFAYYETCQAIGDLWLQHKRTLILRVPSAIILN